MSDHFGRLMIYAPYAIWGPHFETDLELAQRHLDSGGEVIFLSCSGELLTCFPNQSQCRSVCCMCFSRFCKGIAWLNSRKVVTKPFLNLTLEQHKAIEQLSLHEFNSLEDVRKYRLQGADIGVAALSSVISILREPKPDVVRHDSLIRLNLVSAARVFFSLSNHLQADRPKRLVVFNGRYAQLRPALSAARINGIEVSVHERAGVLNRFSLMKNTTPHDIKAIQLEMNRISNCFNGPKEEKKRIADEWFEERRLNVTQGWESFTQKQQLGLLPKLAINRLNLIIFISSEDEMEAFEDWRSPIYENQNDGIRKLLLDKRIVEKFKIFVREHPNLEGVVNSQTRQLREIASHFEENICLIPASSPVSTYSLIDAGDVILTFGSTVGIEAVYKGKPSFLMGRALYEHLACCVLSVSHVELITKLLAYADGDRSMLPSIQTSQEAVTTYGLFSKEWGHLFEHAQVIGLRTVMMKRGNEFTRLRPSLASWLMYQMERLLSCGRKP